MQGVSEAYRKSMRKTVRDKSYMRFILGLINNDAQGSAALDSATTYFSDAAAAIDGEEIRQEYAMLDGGGAPLDDTLVFLPREGNAIPFAGAFSQELLEDQPIVWTFVFGGAHLAIKGLTIEFGRLYPVDFTVEDDTGIAVEVRGNASSSWATDKAWPSAGRLTITVTRMYSLGARLSMKSILFGYGFRFEAKEIFESSFNGTLSPISESVPSFDFSISVKNHGRRFDVDNPESALNYLQIGQECEIYYGYELGAAAEWINGTKVLLDSWSADGEKAEFRASDVLAHLTGEYGRGRFGETTLYDLAEDVFKDADMEEYWIDPYLKTVRISNPMPVMSYPQALQIIANAGRSILTLTRNGTVMIRSSFDPDVTASGNGEEPYSQTETVTSDAAQQSVASFEPGFTILDGSRIFPGEERVSGYVSSGMANGDGEYTEKPILILQLESAMQYIGFSVEFDQIYPRELVCRTYLQEAAVESFTVLPDRAYLNISRELKTFDRMELEAQSGAPYTRVHIQKICFGDSISHHMVYQDMTDVPRGSTDTAVSAISVIRTSYRQKERRELLSDAVTVYPNDGIRRFSLSKPAVELSIEAKGAEIEVLYAGAYEVTVAADVETETSVEIVITGCELEAAEQAVTQKIADVGIKKTWQNPLVSEYSHAADIAEWLGNYYAGTTVYEVPYRGDPAFDVGDSIYQQIPSGEIPVRVYEHKLNFNGALSGTLKTRRITNVGGT